MQFLKREKRSLIKIKKQKSSCLEFRQMSKNLKIFKQSFLSLEFKRSFKTLKALTQLKLISIVHSIYLSRLVKIAFQARIDNALASNVKKNEKGFVKKAPISNPSIIEKGKTNDKLVISS